MSMCVEGTPLEHYPEAGLWVKREDMCCPGGPHFSKTRGVYAHVRARNEGVIGVLDTSHSQGGWAVAKACFLLNKRCQLYYPEFKKPRPLPYQQQRARELRALLLPLPAGRSAVLYHRAKAHLGGDGAYMMPNALKLEESVTETAAELRRTPRQGNVGTVLISASSGTIAAGVIAGLDAHPNLRNIVVHLGYSRPRDAVVHYLGWKSGRQDILADRQLFIIDEGYAYADAARPGETPPFPCNEWYDLKAFRWWVASGRRQYGQALFWNIG